MEVIVLGPIGPSVTLVLEIKAAFQKLGFGSVQARGQAAREPRSADAQERSLRFLIDEEQAGNLEIFVGTAAAGTSLEGVQVLVRALNAG